MPSTPATPPARSVEREELVELAASLDLLLSWVRRNSPPSAYSMTARTTLVRLAAGQPTRISDLAKLEGVTQPAMTALANRLEGEGLVRREADPSDARAALVTLTDAGLAFVEQRRLERTRTVAAQLEQLSAEDQEALLAAGAAIARLTQLPPALGKN